MKSRKWSRGFTLSFFVGVLLACGVQEDEFECENAVAHLAGCCPNFVTTSIDCSTGDSCNGPALTLDQSQCILGASCATIQSLGLCDRASSAASGIPICPESPDAGNAAAEPDVAPPPGCWSAADCPAGHICCTYPTDFTFRGCAPACGKLTQLCQNSTECGPGLTCQIAPFSSTDCPTCQTPPALVGQCVAETD